MSEFTNPDGSPWVARFPGQRPPWQRGNPYRVGAGNDLAATHGAYSASRVEPLARKVVKALRADVDYLRAPGFKGELWDYARAQARVLLVQEWLEGMSMDQAAGREGGTLRGDKENITPFEVLLEFEARADRLARLIGLYPTVSPELQKKIAQARKTLDKRSELERLQADLKESIGRQHYGEDFGTADWVLSHKPPSWLTGKFDDADGTR
jgi:hypothetical protein